MRVKQLAQKNKMTKGKTANAATSWVPSVFSQKDLDKAQADGLISDDDCRGDDFWGMPRVMLSAGWRPRNLHGAKTRRPAPPEGPAAPAVGWRLHRGAPVPGDEDKNPPMAVLPKVAWPQQDR
jgi:hypothetical protein